jgi:Calcineurin-like phosphoesterase
MIADVLSRDFVLEQLKLVQTQLKKDSAGRDGGGPGAEDVGGSDYARAAELVDRTVEKEEAAPSGPKDDGPPPAARRGDAPAPIDQTSFMSSDPVVSIVQSALEFYFDHPQSKDKASSEKPLLTTRRSGAEPPAVTSRVLLRRKPQPAHGPTKRRIFDPFSISDPGWVSSLVAMGIRKFQSPHEFNRDPAPAVEMNDRCRIVMVGDWGSGILRAQKTARAMRVYVEECLKSGIECHVIHLGDVYYSGWDYEVRDRFLRYWPVKPGEEEEVGSWSLNGNHDMYSGGYAYFDTLLADARFRRQNRSSFFRLFSSHWQFLGLDTAWDDNGLKDPQSSWVENVVAHNPQRTMLLTHHQLFSAYENTPDVGQVMRQKLGDVLDAGKIDAAIWGHEHRCVLHNPYGRVRYGRLVGHGGVPVYMTQAADSPYPEPATYEDRRYIQSGLERWAYMGFAVLDLDSDRLEVRYVDENGRLDKSETFI